MDQLPFAQIQAFLAVVERSGLDYAILRPGWFTHDPEVRYELTRKGEPFVGHDVSLNSISDLIAKVATTPGLHVQQSLGVGAASISWSPSEGSWQQPRPWCRKSARWPSLRSIL